MKDRKQRFLWARGGIALILLAAMGSLLLWRVSSADILRRAKRVTSTADWAGGYGHLGYHQEGTQLYFWLSNTEILYFLQEQKNLRPMKLHVDTGETAKLPIALQCEEWEEFLRTTLTPDHMALIWRYFAPVRPPNSHIFQEAQAVVPLDGGRRITQSESFRFELPPLGYILKVEAIWLNEAHFRQMGHRNSHGFRYGVLEFQIKADGKREVEFLIGRPLTQFRRKGLITRTVKTAVPGQGRDISVTPGAEGTRLAWLVSEPRSAWESFLLHQQTKLPPLFPSFKPSPLRFQCYLSDLEGKNLKYLGYIPSKGNRPWQQPHEPHLSPDGKRLGFYFGQSFYVLDLPKSL